MVNVTEMITARLKIKSERFMVRWELWVQRNRTMQHHTGPEIKLQWFSHFLNMEDINWVLTLSYGVNKVSKTGFEVQGLVSFEYWHDCNFFEIVSQSLVMLNILHLRYKSERWLILQVKSNKNTAYDFFYFFYWKRQNWPDHINVQPLSFSVELTFICCTSFHLLLTGKENTVLLRWGKNKSAFTQFNKL